jgi:hypothetical protein
MPVDCEEGSLAFELQNAGSDCFGPLLWDGFARK